MTTVQQLKQQEDFLKEKPMTTNPAPIGIQCAVTYHDSPDGYEDVYISFSEELLNHEGEPAEEDIYGVSDDSIFFYFNADQQEALGVAIAEDKDKFNLGEEWFIDLTEDYELVYEEAKTMNMVVTATVTYELTGVKNLDEAVDIFQTCVKSVRHMDGVQYIGTKELFATEMADDGTFMVFPQMWEMEEVE